MASETKRKKIFRPINRALADIIIFTDLAVLILGTPRGDQSQQMLYFALIVNGVQAVLWFLAARPYFSVEISADKITGPATGIGRVTLDRSKLDRNQSEARSKASRWIGYRDIYSSEGMRIRLYRRVLGRRQIYKIFDELGWAPPTQKGFMSLYPSDLH